MPHPLLRLCAILLSLSISQPLWAAGPKVTHNFSLMIPVRIGIFGGYQSSENNFSGDGKKYSLSGPTAGADFNVPIKGLHGVLGITGWIFLPENTATEKNNFFLITPYLGYSNKSIEIIAGAGLGHLDRVFEGSQATPDKKVDLSMAMGCGFLGTRFYFGKGPTLGLGLNGYYCKASSYDKDQTSMVDVLTNTRVALPASTYGGMAYLMISWGEERKLL